MRYFWVFSAHFAQTSYLFTFRFLAFSSVLMFQAQTETETKNPLFLVFFAVICPFLSQIKCWFSVIYAYIGQITPYPPTFGTRRVGQLSSENFLFFYFLFFVKYYDFANSAFLPNFEHFWEYNIYFSFCIKFHCIYFWLFLCVM